MIRQHCGSGNMSGKDGQGNLKQCRANWSNRLAWIVVIVSGILGVAISEGAVVASPDMRSRHTSTDPARSKPLDSYQEGAEKQPSQCTANFDYPGEANLADLEVRAHTHSSTTLYLAFQTPCLDVPTGCAQSFTCVTYADHKRQSQSTADC